jgi:hypothetical protein
MAVNVGISYLWVAFYSLLIEPGHDAGYYQAYARVAAPYTSIVAGIPLVYLAGRWVARWGQREAPMRNAIALWAIYLGLDLVVMVGAGWQDGITKHGLTDPVAQRPLRRRLPGNAPFEADLERASQFPSSTEES